MSREEAHHARNVLRLTVGAEIELFDGQGRSALALLATVAKSAVVVEVAEVASAIRPGRLVLTLATALPRLARQQTLFEKCTELGVARIVPVLFARSTVRPRPDTVPKWTRSAIEAAKQSGNLFVPAIGKPVDLEGSLGAEAADETRLFGAVGKDAPRLSAAFADMPHGASVTVWIGPEGGLTPAEEELLVGHGVGPVSLGPYTLRVETAAIVVAAAAGLAG